MLNSNQQENIQILEVAFPLAGHATFSYYVDPQSNLKPQIGERVLVPFGKRKIKIGLVVSVGNAITDIPSLKPILDVVENLPIANEKSIQLLQFASQYYICNLGELLYKVYPKSYFLSSDSKIGKGPYFEEKGISLFKENFFLLKQLLDNNPIDLDTYRASFSFRGAIKLLKEADFEQVIEFQESIEKKAKLPQEVVYRLNFQEDKWQEKFQELNRSPKQEEQLLLLYQVWTQSKQDVFPRKQLKQFNDFNSSAFLQLVKKEFVIEEKHEVEFQDGTQIDKVNLVLSEDQSSCLQSLLSSQNHTSVLLGVAASGKTEVYCKWLEEVTGNFQNQALILFPDNVLSHLLIERIAQYLPTHIALLHTKLSEKKRNAVWKAVAENDVKVVIGSTSAVFLPFQSLSAIVIDEEHDQTYRELFSSPYINYKNLAIYHAALHQAKCLLVSATPSLETMQNVELGKYHLAELNIPYHGLAQLKTELIAIDNQKPIIEQKQVLTKEAVRRIQAVLDENKKVLVFRNARGYALSAICRACGHIMQCENCDISLVYHKSQDTLKCHICAAKYNLPDECPDCGSQEPMLIQGAGTQKVEEELEQLFPDTPIIRFDSDSARKQSKQHELLEKIQLEEAQLIIGNRALSKGIDFAGVKLVLFVQAESLLMKSDFRSIEQSYQLLHQLKGRSGRRGEDVELLFQTFQSKKTEIMSLLDADLHTFITHELAHREDFAFPPKVKMIELYVRSQNYHDALNCIKFCHQIMNRELPAQCVLSAIAQPENARMKGYHFFYFAIKHAKNTQTSSQIKQIVRRLVNGVKQEATFKQVMIYPIIDP